jgi:bifunctional non-homologous end joining protein LigD
MALEEYERKRRRGATPEPFDDPPRPSTGDRFVVQEHHATRLHWDLRLERDGVLVSFAIPNGLPEEPGVNRFAAHTEDHPLEYLDFHGEIPAGQYGAGRMTIWDRGTYETLKWGPRKIEVALHGEERLAVGRYALFPIGPDEKDWMVHRMDPPADPDREPMPERLVPMLAKSGDLPADEAAWAYEVKWDGVRAIAYSRPGELRFESRNLRDITASYPELSRLNRALSHHSAVLDGEIVAFDEAGKPSFSRLQRRMHVGSESAARRLARDNPVVYVVFDLLWLDGHPLLGLPYEERRARLEALDLNGERWQTPQNVVGQGRALLDVTAQQGLEGIIAKKLGSPYEPGRRTGCWVKVKHVQRQEVVIGGWAPGEGRRRDRIGALLAGVRDDDGQLRYVGRVGTGFTDAELDRLRGLLAPLVRDASPFERLPASGGPPKGSVFCAPELVADVEFMAWTEDGVLRAPSYKGLRNDKPPGEAVLEPVRQLPKGAVEVRVEDRVLKLSNLDKVLFPAAGFTKGDVIDYYRRIAPVVLPHLEGRPLTLKRYPNGVDEAFFYEKNCPSHRPPWVRTARVRMDTKDIEFCLAEDAATLVWLANLADLELHTGMAVLPDVDRPAILAFDLDPGPPATIVECCRVGLWLQGMFERLGLECFPKTSGSKGMQVYVPLNAPGVTHETTKGFAKSVAELLEQSEPDVVVSRMTKSLRGGKVLVDWSQNDFSKTTVSVYSLRARERPTVSTPVTWDEVRACLDAQDPSLLTFETADVLRRVEELGDLFAPVLSLVQELPRA